MRRVCLKIYFSPVQAIDDQLEVTEGQKVIYSKKLKLEPLKTFGDSLKFSWKRTGPYSHYRREQAYVSF